MLGYVPSDVLSVFCLKLCASVGVSATRLVLGLSDVVDIDFATSKFWFAGLGHFQSEAWGLTQNPEPYTFHVGGKELHKPKHQTFNPKVGT